MRSLIYIVAVAFMVITPVGLTACGTTGGVQLSLPPAPVVSTSGTALDEQGFNAAVASYNAAAASYDSLQRRGILTGAKKESARAGLVKTFQALSAARTAKATLNAEDFKRQLALAVQLTGEVRALFPAN